MNTMTKTGRPRIWKGGRKTGVTWVRYCSVMPEEAVDRLRWLAKKATISQANMIWQGLMLLYGKEPFKSLLKLYNGQKPDQTGGNQP